MNAKQINQTTDLAQLIGYHSTKRGTFDAHPCPFCGGTDRFTIKHTQDGDLWHCRQCGGEGYHTPIDYVMRRDGVDFKTAYKTLAGEDLNPIRAPARPRVVPTPKPITMPAAEWQDKAFKTMDAASDRLLVSEEGHAGREYLTQRGLSPAVWEAWHLGFSLKKDPKAKRIRPVIVIPWLDMDAQKEIIFSIKYRFMDKDPNGLRYISMTGSIPLLYGLWSVIDSDTSLLLIEGELNALSVWQCRPEHVSVLSFGSESGWRMDILKPLALRYQRVFVWADDPKKASELRAVLGSSAEALQSPKQDDVKWDANRMLQEGVLPEFISKRLEVPCQD